MRDSMRQAQPSPVYRQIADELAAEIAGWPAGRLVPSEVRIVGRWGVGRGTARRVIEDLRNRGIVYTVAQCRGP